MPTLTVRCLAKTSPTYHLLGWQYRSRPSSYTAYVRQVFKAV